MSAVDALIVGAGPAGAASALALLQAGVRHVAIVDRPVRHYRRISESASPDVGGLLRRLGLTERLEELGHLPCFGNVSVWGDTVPAVDDFLRRGVGHGWHLDRAAFDGWLLQQAVERGATLIETSGVAAVASSRGRRWCVRLDARGRSPDVIAAAVIVATGRAVATPLRFGAELRRVDRLIALTALSSAADWKRFQGYSLVEAVEPGWWYAAPLPGGEAMVTLMTDHDLARMHHLRGREQFVRAWAGSELLKTFLPPPAVAECEIVIRPAATQYLDRAAGPGWIAVGDALMAFDPLSSAGIGGALREAIDLSAALVRFLGGSSGADARQAAEAYASRASGSLRRFLVERRAMYARERRWPDSLFWRRRTTDVPGGATIGADHH